MGSIWDIEARKKMTPKEIQVLAQACRMAGVDATKITPVNPFEKSGGTASMIQAAVSELDPGQAAKWRVAAGGGLSVATLAELEGGGELSAAARSDLYAHDYQFVADLQKQKAAEAVKAEQWLKEAGEATALRNKVREMGGNEAAAKERLKLEAEQDEARRASAEASAQQARELQGRMDQKRVEQARMAGRLI